LDCGIKSLHNEHFIKINFLASSFWLVAFIYRWIYMRRIFFQALGQSSSFFLWIVCFVWIHRWFCSLAIRDAAKKPACINDFRVAGFINYFFFNCCSVCFPREIKCISVDGRGFSDGRFGIFVDWRMII